MLYKLEGFYHPAHGKSYSWTNYDFLSLFHSTSFPAHTLNVSLVLQQQPDLTQCSAITASATDKVLFYHNADV